MGLITPTEFDAVSRLDLAVFTQRVFNELNPATPYADNFHIDLMAMKLDAVRCGEIRRLIINVPPRSLKSILGSVALPAWVLGHEPTRQVVAISYGQELADALARDCRQVMLAPWFEQVFPGCRVSPDRMAAHDFETTAGGRRLATSVGGVLMGRGGDLIVIDDPVKPDEALSEAGRRRANDWFSHSLVTRLNDKTTGAIVVIMQRLHEDDFVGHVLALDRWEVVALPAIAQQDEVHAIETAIGRYRHVRRTGEALHPAREPLEVLEQLRTALGPDLFAAQYLQSPTPPGGGMFKPEWFRRYDDPPASFERYILSWDTASKAGERNDFSVCTVWGVKDKVFYLLNVWRRRAEYPELKAQVLAMAGLYPNPTVVIEDKGVGTALIQELRKEGLAVADYQPEGDKLFRAAAQTAFIEAGRVLLPREAHWLEAFEHELAMFPNGKFDDQVDSLSQALDHGRNRSSFADWAELFGSRFVTREPRAPSLRVRHVGIPWMTLYTITGRRPPREPDGSFLLTAEEWQPLRGQPGWICENEPM
jgi:predicted phage terminase large subunit-like protein